MKTKIHDNISIGSRRNVPSETKSVSLVIQEFFKKKPTFTQQKNKDRLFFLVKYRQRSRIVLVSTHLYPRAMKQEQELSGILASRKFHSENPLTLSLTSLFPVCISNLEKYYCNSFQVDFGTMYFGFKTYEAQEGEKYFLNIFILVKS